MKCFIAFLLIVYPLTACASTPLEERKDYILSRPDSLDDVTIADSNIPDVVSRYDVGNSKSMMHVIFLLMQIVRFSFHNIYPDGLEAPYSVNNTHHFGSKYSFRESDRPILASQVE